jgi:hypothetical protein
MYELLQASGYAALVYLLLNYFISFGSGRPLVEAINPNRKYLPLFALGMFGIAYTLILKAVWKYHESHVDLLRQLVNEEKAKSEVVGAVSFVIFGISVLLLYVWCYWNLPRDPKTFSPNPRDLNKEYRKALQHYVRWAGGIDYAFLGEVKSGVHTVIADGASNKDIRRGLLRLPEVKPEEVTADPQKAIEQQKAIWRQEAARVVAEWANFNRLIEPARQGCTITLCFDLKVGACYIEMMELPTEVNGGMSCLYIFASSLNQYEVNTMTAGRHFYSLAEAIRTIRRGVIKR